MRGSEKHRRHPATAVAYGSANALIVDGLALLLDLKDVYWASGGRKSVDAAITVIAAGGTFLAGSPFWPHARAFCSPVDHRGGAKNSNAIPSGSRKLRPEP